MGFDLLAAVSSMLIGAGLTLLVAHLHPRWLGLASRATVVERLEEMRHELLEELRELEEPVPSRPLPIRMELPDREPRGRRTA